MSEPGSLLRSLSGQARPRNFHSHVIHALGSGVIAGQFPQGSTLPGDAELCDQFDVSRTVLREAIKTLEAKGLLESRPKVGTKVTRKNHWNLFDPQVLAWYLDASPDREFLKSLHDVRMALEPLTAAQAASFRSGDQLRLMHYWLRQMELSQAEPLNFCLADFELHLIIADASRNPFLRAAYGMVELSHAFAYLHIVANDRQDALAPFLDPHRMLVTQIERGDPQGATSAMQAVILLDQITALNQIDHQSHPMRSEA
ncbi:FadR/GntR family transcriptional regulator [Rhizobium paknamense]|uniref:DNA-binding FadR family transcriptional regulator n=1 Tax=Rhizobium paknamense TaxID=1206817 RepID=A0ABU0IIF8_9HYPH|nr:FadR/GntR family transcriptional regulator [Rhizobium paknamense]MDQ0458042.1 DNA-binding FadR family transcriptional regulator [Rhizobium paknamense]